MVYFAGRVQMLDSPHPRLVPYLLEVGLDFATFCKKGRPAEGVWEKRSQIVTALHLSGCTWAEMMEITGLSLGGIHRLTKATWNEASLQNRRDNAIRVGKMRAGEKKPWLSQRLKERWAAGFFDFHRGRKATAEERERQVAWWTPDRRREAGDRVRRLVWGVEQTRSALLGFHQSPEERARRSEAQVIRMQNAPSKYLRGRAQEVVATKEARGRIFVRSSYEAAAVLLLEKDPSVKSFEYEARFVLGDGRWILPDFLVTKTDGTCVLIEVKAVWTLRRPAEERVQVRLAKSRELAGSRGWGFQIWTEKELCHALHQ